MVKSKKLRAKGKGREALCSMIDAGIGGYYD